MMDTTMRTAPPRRDDIRPTLRIFKRSASLSAVMVIALLSACSGGGGSDGNESVWQRLRAAADPIARPEQAVWDPVKNMTLSVASAANLPDGKVLMWAADSQSGFGSGGSAYYTVYDPVSGVFTDKLANALGHNLFCPGTTNLPDGRILVNGGSQASNTSIFDPFSPNAVQWGASTQMNIPRAYNSNTLLQDGSAFTIGGSWAGGSGNKHGEVWTPAGGWKRLSGALVDTLQAPDKNGPYRGDNHMWLLPTGNGRVLHAGPAANMNWIDTRGNGAITPAGTRLNDPYSMNGSAVMYDIGKILKLGGSPQYDGENATGNSYIIDVNAELTVKKVASMAYARAFQNTVVLPNGQVVVIGGQTFTNVGDDSTSVYRPELFDPATESFTLLPAMSKPRNYHSVALLMPDATVMSSGNNMGVGNPQLNMQILRPHYLFNADGTPAARPTITSAPMAVNYGASSTVTTNAEVTSFALVRASSNTHAVNNDQRRIPLTFTANGGNSYNLNIPTNPGWALPGYYMLFALDARGVPSVAKMVKLSNDQAPQITPLDDQSTAVGALPALNVQSSNPTGAAMVYSAEGLPPGITMNTTTGAFQGSPTTLGKYLVKPRVSNGLHTVSTQFFWTVTATAPADAYRYVKLEALSEINGNAWSSMAEFNVLGAAGSNLPRTGWTVSADSAETGGENGAVANVLDGDVNTFWHTQWSTANPRPPHWIRVDLGSPQRLSGFRYMPRPGSGNGTIATFSFYVSTDGVAWNKLLDSAKMADYPAGANAERTVPLTVVTANRAPTLATPGAQTATQGQAASLTLVGNDPEGAALTYSATGLPAGLTLQANTGVISGVASTAGSYTVGVGVSDTQGLTASASFVWTVQAPAVTPVTISPVAAPLTTANTAVSYTANTTGSAAQYNWSFGDNTADSGYSANKTVNHTYATAGVYTVTLSVKDTSGKVTTSLFYQAVGATAVAGKAAASSSLVVESRVGTNPRVWVVNPDNDSVSIFNASTNSRDGTVTVGQRPRSIALSPSTGRLWVVNKGSATISLIDPASTTVVQTIALPRGSQPYGLVFANDGSAFVVLEALGQVVKVSAAGVVGASLDVGANPRHIARTPDGSKLLVSRFITPAQPGEGTAAVQTTLNGVKVGGEVIVLDAASFTVTKAKLMLQHSDKADTENSGRGVPNYLGAAAISPDGKTAWIPSKQDNILRGALRDGTGLNFQNTVRAISSRIDLGTLTEDYAGRIDHDNSSLASAALYHPSGAYLFVALETSREIAVVDAIGKRNLFTLKTGLAPQGLALSADGRKLYVSNFMDRSVGVYDLSSLLDYGQTANVPAATVMPTVAAESNLTPDQLKGKQLFYDAKDTRLARDSYMSCASCHNDGSHDGRTWDFTGFGEGLRNTISLRGRAGAQGNKHWTGNFDEIQDFEGQIRAFAGGTGLMSDAQFNTGTRNTQLGDKKAGVSADLDALAAYVISLSSFEVSPLRTAAGALTTAGVAGKTVFTAQCASCHGGADYTNSAGGTFANVGTLKASSGKRLGATLTGLDVPTLRDAWATAPYLHDGSAATVSAAIAAHTNLTLSTADLASVSAFVQQIGGDEAGITPPPTPATLTGRYVKFEATSEVNGGPWTSMAEFNLLNSTGQTLSRTGWTARADSEEKISEPGAVSLIFDGNAGTFWHTAYSSGATAIPHWVVIDTLAVQTFGGFRYMPRSGGGNGTVAKYNLYISRDGVNWGSPVSTGNLMSLGAAAAEKTVLLK